jgi:hypothetical protein
MKAKIKSGHNLLFSEGTSNDWSELKDRMIINFMDKWRYSHFRQWKNHLFIFTLDGTVDIVFTGDIPVLEFDFNEKDQLVFNII